MAAFFVILQIISSVVNIVWIAHSELTMYCNTNPNDPICQVSVYDEPRGDPTSPYYNTGIGPVIGSIHHESKGSP